MNILSGNSPRIAIIGNCQASGLAAAARSLVPDAEVKSWHVGVHPKDSDDELLALLPWFDVVISQLSDWDTHVPLRISNLRKLGLPVTYLPGMMFPGFQPDLTYLTGPQGLIRGPLADYHSIIIAAAYTMDIPERRVSNLFNNYIFAELGYFEVFDAAKASLFASFDSEGFDLRPFFPTWLAEIGQFMYTVNHPHISVLTTLCSLALVRAGVLDHPVTSSNGVEDYLATHLVWPTYPGLASRLGIPGSTVFSRGAAGLTDGKARAMSLVDCVSESFKFYGTVEKGVLRVGNVAKACDRLMLAIE